MLQTNRDASTQSASPDPTTDETDETNNSDVDMHQTNQDGTAISTTSQDATQQSKNQGSSTQSSNQDHTTQSDTRYVTGGVIVQALPKCQIGILDKERLRSWHCSGCTSHIYAHYSDKFTLFLHG